MDTETVRISMTNIFLNQGFNKLRDKGKISATDNPEQIHDHENFRPVHRANIPGDEYIQASRGLVFLR